MTSYEVEIEKIVAGGDGLARHEGRAVFVPRSAPGERHLVRTLESKRDYVRAESVDCLAPSSSRREPPCPYYHRCGGCSLMHLTPEAQRDVKRAILRESLERAGARNALDENELHVTPSPEDGYRTRLRFHVSLRDDRVSLGFHRRASHVVEDIDHCRLASDELNVRWRRIREWVRERPSRARGLVSIELQESSTDRGRVVGRFVVSSSDGVRRFEELGERELLRATDLDGVVVGAERGRGRVVRVGTPRVHHRVHGLELRQSAGAFFQANRFLLETLVASVTPASAITRMVDLYCGAGLFSIPLSPRAREVVGVETSPVAIRDAIDNAQAASSGARFVRADAARFAERWEFSRDDHVIVDPPRGGLPRALREAVGRSPLGELCYVSCDAPALARDVAFLRRFGFRVRRLHLLDLFPNTHHFETVAWLDRAALDPLPREERY